MESISHKNMTGLDSPTSPYLFSHLSPEDKERNERIIKKLGHHFFSSLEKIQDLHSIIAKDVNSVKQNPFLLHTIDCYSCENETQEEDKTKLMAKVRFLFDRTPYWKEPAEITSWNQFFDLLDLFGEKSEGVFRIKLLLSKDLIDGKLALEEGDPALLMQNRYNPAARIKIIEQLILPLPEIEALETILAQEIANDVVHMVTKFFEDVAKRCLIEDHQLRYLAWDYLGRKDEDDNPEARAVLELIKKILSTEEFHSWFFHPYHKTELEGGGTTSDIKNLLKMPEWSMKELWDSMQADGMEQGGLEEWLKYSVEALLESIIESDDVGAAKGLLSKISELNLSLNDLISLKKWKGLECALLRSGSYELYEMLLAHCKIRETENSGDDGEKSDERDRIAHLEEAFSHGNIDLMEALIMQLSQEKIKQIMPVLLEQGEKQNLNLKSKRLLSFLQFFSDPEYSFSKKALEKHGEEVWIELAGEALQYDLQMFLVLIPFLEGRVSQQSEISSMISLLKKSHSEAIKSALEEISEEVLEQLFLHPIIRRELGMLFPLEFLRYAITNGNGVFESDQEYVQDLWYQIDEAAHEYRPLSQLIERAVEIMSDLAQEDGEVEAELAQILEFLETEPWIAIALAARSLDLEFPFYRVLVYFSPEIQNVIKAALPFSIEIYASLYAQEEVLVQYQMVAKLPQNIQKGFSPKLLVQEIGRLQHITSRYYASQKTPSAPKDLELSLKAKEAFKLEMQLWEEIKKHQRFLTSDESDFIHTSVKEYYLQQIEKLRPYNLELYRLDPIPEYLTILNELQL
jgi:hypothetical protein